MFPSKADRILSRYRPIAPKLPLPAIPIPPSATTTHTDLSSTCASLDSFASTSQIRRSRKRRITPATTLSSSKCPKTRKSDKLQVVSTLSNNNAGVCASSLTQGSSDGTVPGIDLSHCTSPSYGPVLESATATTQHLMMDVSDRSRVPMGEPSMVGSPFHPHNLVEQARMFMVVDALKARQPSLPHSCRLRGYPAGAMTEKDVAFMERAAASSVIPDKGPGLSCSSAVCMKGAGYAGGGFTEMIRGITRLPTVADVQSLMQARSGTAGTVGGASPGMSLPTTESRRTSPSHKGAHHQRLELQSSAPCHLLQAPLPPHITLPLLPCYPSKHPLPPTLEADSLVHKELPFDQNKVRPHSEGPPMHLSVSSCPDEVLAPSMLGNRGLCGQVGVCKQSHEEAVDAEALSLSPPSQTTNSLWASAGSPTLSRNGLCGQVGVFKLLQEEAINAEALALSPPSQITNSLGASPGSSTLSRNGVSVDHVYLQQVYGESTDPILLVDVNYLVLWFNKAYERALKSVLERLSSKPAATGPYIDPLGHPTPLGSLVLNQAGGIAKPVNATLWGFLRKLVMPDVGATPNLLQSLKLEVSRKEQQGEDNDTGRLCLNVGGRGPHSVSDECSNSLPASRTDDTNDAQVCGGMGKLTTVTLESITEVHMGQGATVVECVETAESRLGASGSVPAFITDCTSRVRWVNTAFKQMLGQAEQPSSSMMTSMHPTDSTVVKHEPPELTFVGAAEKIPWSAWAFSGLVNLEWMKAGKRRSMTVPCDVSRLAPAATWVWKFDLALSLSLNLCA